MKKASTLYLVSAIFWFCAAYLNQESLLAAVSLFAHFLAWQNHRIEVKLNKLLGDHNIFVADYEFDD